tara:strand:- start:115 stop:285 length:171 start_codon:yes stop_codon:yes gene_type:complete
MTSIYPKLSRNGFKTEVGVYQNELAGCRGVISTFNVMFFTEYRPMSDIFEYISSSL